MESVPDDIAATLTVPRLLSVATVGRLLDCSPKTVRRRIAAGTSPAVIDNDRMMVRADELRRHIEGLDRVVPARRAGRRAHSRVSGAVVGDEFDFLRG